MMRRRAIIMAGVVGALVAMLLASVLLVEAQGPPDPEYTNFQIQNLSSETANVVVEFYDASGTLVVSDTNTIPANDSISYTQNPCCEPLGLPDGFRGSVVISSDQPVAAIGNQFVMSTETYPTPYIAAAYGGEDTPDTHWELPLMFRQYNTWDSRYAVQNTSSVTATVNITYTTIPAGSVAKTDSVAIAPNGALYRALYDDDSDLGSDWQGAVTIDADQNVVAMSDSFFSGYTPGAYQCELNYSGLTDSDADTTVYLPVLFRKYLAPDFGWNTNLFVTNLGASDADVTIEYFGGGIVGTVTETATIATSARFQQYSNTNLPDGWAGSGKITSDQPIVAVVIEATSSGPNDKATAYAGVPVGTTTQNVSIPFLMKMHVDLWNTNFTIQNAGGAPADVTVTYRGGGLSSPVSVPMVVTDTVWVSQYWESGLPWGWRGNATVTSDQLIAVVANENSITLGDLSETYNAINFTP